MADNNYPDPEIQDQEAGHRPQIILQVEHLDEDEYNENNENIHLVKKSKMIKLFVLIDMIFLLIGAIYNPYNFIFVLFPLLGWYGATLFKGLLTFGYVIYLVLELALTIYVGLNVFTVISIVINCFIMLYVISFIRSVFKLTHERRGLLKTLSKHPDAMVCGFI